MTPYRSRTGHSWWYLNSYIKLFQYRFHCNIITLPNLPPIRYHYQQRQARTRKKKVTNHQTKTKGNGSHNSSQTCAIRLIVIYSERLINSDLGRSVRFIIAALTFRTSRGEAHQFDAILSILRNLRVRKDTYATIPQQKINS